MSEQDKARQIIEGAIDALIEMGAERHEALNLLAYQSILRLGDDDMPWKRQLEILEGLQAEIANAELKLRECFTDDSVH